VGDNIDKNFRPTFQRHDNKTTSLHAVKDRIDCSAFSDTPGSVIDVSKVLINNDIKQLNKDLEVLISRNGIVFVYHSYQYGGKLLN